MVEKSAKILGKWKRGLGEEQVLWRRLFGCINNEKLRVGDIS